MSYWDSCTPPSPWPYESLLLSTPIPRDSRGVLAGHGAGTYWRVFGPLGKRSTLTVDVSGSSGVTGVEIVYVGKGLTSTQRPGTVTTGERGPRSEPRRTTLRRHPRDDTRAAVTRVSEPGLLVGAHGPSCRCVPPLRRSRCFPQTREPATVGGWAVGHGTSLSSRDTL